MGALNVALCPKSLGIGGLRVCALRKIQERKADGHSYGRVVALEFFIELIVIVISGEHSILSSKVNRWPQRAVLCSRPEHQRSGLELGGLQCGIGIFRLC